MRTVEGMSAMIDAALEAKAQLVREGRLKREDPPGDAAPRRSQARDLDLALSLRHLPQVPLSPAGSRKKRVHTVLTSASAFSAKRYGRRGAVAASSTLREALRPGARHDHLPARGPCPAGPSGPRWLCPRSRRCLCCEPWLCPTSACTTRCFPETPDDFCAQRRRMIRLRPRPRLRRFAPHTPSGGRGGRVAPHHNI